MTAAALDLEQIDASVLEAVASSELPARLSVDAIRTAIEARLELILVEDFEAVTPLAVHRAIRAGLPGASMITAGSLAYDTIEGITEFFDTTPKTLRERIRQPRLRTDESERVIRMGRVMLAARRALGSFEAARRYVRTKNFALGGAVPLELMHTAEGERLVLDELQAHADSGPL